MVGIIKFFGVLSVIVGAFLVFIGLVTVLLLPILLPLGANALLGGALLLAFARVVELLESINEKISPVHATTAAASQSFSTTSKAASPSTPTTRTFDEQKWRALAEFDPDLTRVDAALRPYGQKYVDQFAAEYLVLSDKSYIPRILEKIVETARQDAAEMKAAERRWGQRFSDPAYVLKFADEKFDYLISRSYGNIAILKDRSVLFERNGEVTKYPDAAALRDVTNDRESWMNTPDDESKIRLVKLLANHLPK